MKCYAVISASPAEEREKLLEVIDKLPEIVNWRTASGAIFVVSEKSENWISNKIHAVFPSLIFLVTLIDVEQSQGYQDEETWKFMQNPKKA
jgi:hypothetical protein